MGGGGGVDTTAGGTPSRWFRGAWTDRVRALAAGRLTPVTPRRAATVMLVRDVRKPRDVEAVPAARAGTHAARDGDDGGLAVFMLRRRASLGFASGVYAYPGGGVDPRDEAPVAWAGPSRATWAVRLGLAGPTASDDGAAAPAAPEGEVPPEVQARAQAVVCAAVRETFEESGVLLAGPDPDTVVTDTSGPDWEADRVALVARELSLTALLARRHLLLRSDLLAFWTRWITPEFEERRYDTWFFTAALPAGQRTRNASTEADHTAWLTPRWVLDAHARGEVLLLPPTLATLRDLAGHRSVAGLLATDPPRDPSPVRARVWRDGDALVVGWPGYDEFEERIPLA